MEIDSLSTLADAIVSLDKKTRESLIGHYGNLREAHGIEEGWKRATDLQRKLRNIRRKKYKDTLLDYDEENRCVSLEELIRFFAAIEDELKVTMAYGEPKDREFAVNLHDFMWNRLGNIKVDRRFIFQPEK